MMGHKGLQGPGVFRRSAGAAVVRALGHKELGPTFRKTVPQSPGKGKGETPVFFSVDKEDGPIDSGGEIEGADGIKAPIIKYLHPEQHHGRKKETEEKVVGPVKAQ